MFGKHTDYPARLLESKVVFQRTKACVDAREDSNFLIIASTDAIYLKDDPEGVVARVNAYLDARADAGFIVFKGFIGTLAEFRIRAVGVASGRIVGTGARDGAESCALAAHE